MKRKPRNIIVGMLVIIIGLPMVLILSALAYCSVLDKTTGTIFFSGIARRYLLPAFC
jgi:hypothetical protein